MSSKDIKTHTFANGFHVVYQKSNQSNPLTSIYVLCNVGSAYEPVSVRGASHLVEHMCFKGTSAVNNPKKLLLHYNKMGANINAYTEKRYTSYVIKAHDTHTEQCLTTLSDMLLHSTFSKKEFEKERRVVVEETIRLKDDEQDLLQTQMDTVYFKGSSYEYPIDAKEYHDTRFSYEDICEWYHWFYHPSNMICSIVTNHSFSDICTLLSKTDFATMKDNGYRRCLPKVALYPSLQLHAIKDTPIQYITKKGVAANTLILGFRTCSRSSKDKYALNVLQSVLNGMSGRLFTLLRTNHGLTYRSTCDTVYHEHTGFLQIYLQTDPKKLQEVVSLVTGLVASLRKDGVTAEEVVVAKEKLKGQLLVSMQSIDTIAEYNGVECALSPHCEFVPYEKVYDTCIAPITRKCVQDVVERYLCTSHQVMGIVYDGTHSKGSREKIM